MFIPIMNQQPVPVEKQEPCKDVCMYARDLGMPEHSCSGRYCDHYKVVIHVPIGPGCGEL